MSASSISMPAAGSAPSAASAASFWSSSSPGRESPERSQTARPRSSFFTWPAWKRKAPKRQRAV
eukprot:3425-Alexandrium_andersonii.AAC.1